MQPVRLIPTVKHSNCERQNRFIVRDTHFIRKQ